MFDFQSLRDRFTAPQRATVLDDEGRPALVLNFTVKDDLVRLSVETFQDGYLTVAYDTFTVWEDGSVLVDQNGAVAIHNTPAAVEACWAAFKQKQAVEVLTAEGVAATAEQVAGHMAEQSAQQEAV